MKRVLTYMFILVYALVFVGCADDGEKASRMSEGAFASLFPKCSVKEWDVEPGYEVAHFSINGNDAEAWFDHNGWVMTFRESDFGRLPQEAQDIIFSEYQLWETIGVNRIDRKGCATVYVVTVERNKVVYDLYFAENGTLVRKCDETNAKPGVEKYLPAPANEDVKAAVVGKYPDAVIYNAVVKNGAYVVCFVSGNVARTAVFADDGSWLTTLTPISVRAVCGKVKESVERQCPGARIVDCVLTESPSSTFYTVECDYEGIPHTLYLNK